MLDHGPANLLPECGGHRPHLNVLVRLDDLQNRARAACLDFGGVTAAEALRHLACDAAVVPIVLDGAGQPSTWAGRPGRFLRECAGRWPREIVVAHTPGVGARRRGCECHHIIPWERGGATTLSNLEGAHR